jgi:hypothetical protein
MDRSTTPVYVPTGSGLSSKDSWEIVRGALEDDGWTDIRPAPMPSMAFVPRSLRGDAARAHG